MPKNNEVVKVTHLNKTFISKNGIVKAIDDVSFSIKKGEIVGLIGESGSGKTTIGRTLLRLHKADSGSINIDGHDYAQRKISKKSNKKLRNNAQMIFQDPYSSLNGQKNILNIVSEPLKVNGTDKKMVKSYLKERNDMMLFFKHALNSFYWEKEWKDKKEFLEKRINLSKKFIEEAEKIEFTTEDPKLSFYTLLITLFFKERIELNSWIVNKTSDDLEIYLNEWKEKNSKLEEESIDDWDEIALLKAEKNFEKASKNLEGSANTRKYQQQIKKVNKEINRIEEDVISLNKSSMSLFSEMIDKIKQENKESKINISIAKNYGEQNYSKLILAKNRIVLDKVSKAEEKLNPIALSIVSSELFGAMSTTISSLYGEKYEKYKNESLLDSTAPKNFSDIYEELLAIEWNDTNPFEIYVKEQIELNTKQRMEIENEIISLRQKEKEIKVEIAKLIEKDGERDEEKLKKEFDEAKEALNEAKKNNEDEREKYSKQYEIEFQARKNEVENNLSKLKMETMAIEAEAKKVFDSKLAELDSVESKYLMEENEEVVSIKLLEKTVKTSLKDKKEKNEALKGEYKRLVQNKKIIRQLYGIEKTVALPLKLRKFLVKMEVFSTLKHAGLQPSHAFRYPHEFSGGMRQRVGIARAIINKPKFIIADEPIAALDLSIQAQVVNMLLEQKERLGLAMLFIAHDLSMVRFNSDRILIMHLGKLVEYGETEEVFNNPKHPYTKNLIKTMPSLDNLSQGFHESNFEATYLKGYSLSNKPNYVQIGSKDHFVLADEEQAIEWIGKKAVSKVENNDSTEEKDEVSNEVAENLSTNETPNELIEEQNGVEVTKDVETAREVVSDSKTIQKAVSKAANKEKQNSSVNTLPKNEEAKQEQTPFVEEVKVSKIPKKYTSIQMKPREKRFGGMKSKRSSTVPVKSFEQKPEVKIVQEKPKAKSPSKVKEVKVKEVKAKKTSLNNKEQESKIITAPERRVKLKYQKPISRRGNGKSLRTGKNQLK